MTNKAENRLPEEFIRRLKTIIPDGDYERVIRSFETDKPITFRINHGRSKEETLNTISQTGLQVEEVPWYDRAYIVRSEAGKEGIKQLEAQEMVYRQGLSSMLVPVVLSPQPGETVLDACAAPGSKTTQMAQMMQDTGEIVAVEGVKQRLYKLKAVVKLQGVNNVKTVLMDARKYRPRDTEFDKILVDAPCSSEGRFNTADKKSFAYWSVRKIREMRKKQKGILLNTSRLLKPGGVLIYSTCTFAPEENEQVVDWFLKKSKGAFTVEEIQPAEFAGLESYPAVGHWGDMTFTPEVARCLRILPSDCMDGFFITKFRRVT